MGKQKSAPPLASSTRWLSPAPLPTSMLRPPLHPEPSLNARELVCFHRLVLGTCYLFLVEIFCVFIVGQLHPRSTLVIKVPQARQHSALTRERVRQNSNNSEHGQLWRLGRETRGFTEEVSGKALQVGPNLRF